MNDIGKLILRLGMGGMMLTHGWGKFQNLIAGGPYEFASPLGTGPAVALGLAVFAEFVCAILVVVGFKVKWTTIPLIITMAVAAFMIHGSDPFAKKELALTYLVGYVAIALIGAGKYSVDGRKRW